MFILNSQGYKKIIVSYIRYFALEAIQIINGNNGYFKEHVKDGVREKALKWSGF